MKLHFILLLYLALILTCFDQETLFSIIVYKKYDISIVIRLVSKTNVSSHYVAVDIIFFNRSQRLRKK